MGAGVEDLEIVEGGGGHALAGDVLAELVEVLVVPPPNSAQPRPSGSATPTQNHPPTPPFDGQGGTWVLRISKCQSLMRGGMWLYSSARLNSTSSRPSVFTCSSCLC